MTTVGRALAVVAAIGLVTASMGVLYPVAASPAGYGGLTGTDPLDAVAGTSGAFLDESGAPEDATSDTSDASVAAAESSFGGPRDRSSADPLSTAAEPSGDGRANQGRVRTARLAGAVRNRGGLAS